LEIPTAIILVYMTLTTFMYVFADILAAIVLARVFVKDPQITEVSERESRAIPDHLLPIVTILLPVYKEELTLPYLFKSIGKINYPKDKLDIRILIEPDDQRTLRSVLTLPRHAREVNAIKYSKYGFPKVLKVWDKLEVNIEYIYLHPKGARTKPNALNKGLSGARGSILTIYDAEDRPDPNQLRKAVVYLLKHPEVTCVQARLAYYNSDQSLLTKFFSIEYVQHFLVLLPAYYALRRVILLGGTSNYFRTEILRTLDGWDVLNVSEDADLGIRLARKGHIVVPINSTTWEEAPPKLKPWVKQRARWNKGFLYSLHFHFKNPFSLVKDLGFGRTVFLLYLLISPIIFVVSIPGWIMFTLYWIDWSGTPMPIVDYMQEAFAGRAWLFYLSLATFIFSFTYMPLISVESLMRHGDEYALKKVKYSFLMTFYIYLQIIPSTLAVYEFIRKPKVWHKTPHGFSIKPAEVHK
jgi:cellulose synthase/poly-beta-1,6-N-acetylglucosamine synthase-like glycosyltransferase